MKNIVFKTPWGWMGMAATLRGVRAIVLPRASRQAVERELLRRVLSSNGAMPSSVRAPHGAASSGGKNATTEKLLHDARRQVVEFLQGGRRTLNFPIDLSGGSPFQRKVWNAILRIPYSRVRSYKWVAARVGGPRYARAVGLALGANPVPLIVPCHRVVASARRNRPVTVGPSQSARCNWPVALGRATGAPSNGPPGSLGGFTGGLRMKRRLLALEGTLPQLAGGTRRGARG